MSLRKIIGLLAGFALAVGLIGAGVGAQFTDSVTAQQNISVGTFSCTIASVSGVGVTQVDAHTLTYAAPEIDSSAAGSDPVSFTVTNTGSITQVQTITSAWAGNLPLTEFSNLLPATAPQTVVGGNSYTYSGGIAWTVLGSGDLGKSGSITYTVACGEVGQ